LVVVMFNEGKVALTNLKRNFSSSVELSIQTLSVQTSVKVVSNDVKLVETVPETLGGWDVVYFTETEDVLVFSMSQSGTVNFQ